MEAVAKVTFVVVLAVACAACSPSQNPSPQPTPTTSVQPSMSVPTPSGSAIPMTAPGSAGSSDLADVAPPTNGPTLGRLLQRPAFAKAFESMDGASKLPSWVRQGGVATPSRRMQVDGKTMWLADACESSQCDTGELWLLVDPDSHTTQGLFEEQTGDTDAAAGKLIWLGSPDATVRTFLKEHIAEN